MQMNLNQLRNKIKGCWAGKNIGGVLGWPYEGMRQINNVDSYIQDFKGNPPANDDLDLQIIWMMAVEQYGRQVDANILGDYWLSYIIPHWAEYGSAKANMTNGLMPPLSGHVENVYGDSCGCFIRSEIWACLAPGRPELAVAYAYEDAIVDHKDDGMYAEIFCAALQSAAFVESDKDKLIEIALSYVPKDCGVARAAEAVIKAYNDCVDYLEARERLFKTVPGAFGLQGHSLEKLGKDVVLSAPGDDAANNVGIMLIGWYYGEGDFGKSLCIAVNCGEDTDCTAATLGATMGIILGYDNIPEKWLEPLGGVINTLCINKTAGLPVPQTVDELTDRVLRVLPSFLGRDICKILDGYTVEMLEGDKLFCPPNPEYLLLSNGIGLPKYLSTDELLVLSPYCVKFNFGTFYVVADYIEEPYIKVGQPRKIKLRIYDNGLTRHQQWVSGTIYTQPGVSIVQGATFSTAVQNTYKYKAEVEFDILAEYIHGDRVEVLVDLSIAGRHTYGVVKLTLLAKL